MPKAKSATARRAPLSLLLGPSKTLQRVRGELLYPVVFSFRETVLGIEKPVVAGELLTPVMEPPHRRPKLAGRRRC